MFVVPDIEPSTRRVQITVNNIDAGEWATIGSIRMGFDFVKFSGIVATKNVLRQFCFRLASQ